MIQLDISVALFVYLFFTVIVVFFIWIWLEKDSKLKGLKKKRETVWQCSVCSYVYVDSKNDEFSRCPRCNSINAKKETGNT